MGRPSPQTDRVVAVIELLADRGDGATMTEIARTIGINQATCVHLLASLVASGVVFRESDRRYHLGPALVRPGRVAADRYPMLAAAREEMSALSAAFGAPCFAFTPGGDHAVLAQATGASTLVPRVRIGDSVPIVPPLGLVFVVWGPDDAFDAWLARADGRDGAEVDRFRAHRGAVRELGFVVELAPEQLPEDALVAMMDDRQSPFRDGRLHRLLSDHGGDDHLLTELGPRHDGDGDQDVAVASVAAPAFGPDGAVVVSLNLVTYATPMTTDRIGVVGSAVRAAADRLTERIGGREPGDVASS